MRITVPVHFAPPDNRPTIGERDTCRPWLARELELLRPTLRAILVLGAFAWQALLPVLTDAGWQLTSPFLSRPVSAQVAPPLRRSLRFGAVALGPSCP